MRSTALFLVLAQALGLYGPFLPKLPAQQQSATSPEALARYPAANLQTKLVKAHVYLPDAKKGYYRGTRFDWSGLVSRVEYNGHSFFSEFKTEHDPLNHDDICGTAEEFGIESAPSYAQAKPGEPFIKIGIGVLERADDSPYAFWKRYNTREPGEWGMVVSLDAISFGQKLHGPNGWAYEFTKKVSLSSSEPELRIARRLLNTGTQAIDTDHYDHNFMRIDGVPAGTNYTIEFKFAPRFGTDSRAQGCVELKDKSLVFSKEPAADQAIWVRLEGFKEPSDNWIRIVNHATGAAMTITTDQPLSKLVFYSSGGVLCPEAFVKLDLPPGQSREWTTTYRFEEPKRK